jgi:hypothetical protein
LNGTLKTTLVWNREITASCSPANCPASNLDLYAYDGAEGNTTGSSTSSIRNVEQVVASAAGTTVSQVMPVALAGGIDAEPFALAISAGGFSAKNGPSLSVSCTGPSGSVMANATFVAVCGVTNSGDDAGSFWTS